MIFPSVVAALKNAKNASLDTNTAFIHERETNNELGSHLFAFAGTTEWSENKVSNLHIIDKVDRSDAKSNDKFDNIAT